MHIIIQTHASTRTCTCAHTNTHTHAHTHAHTITYMHTYTLTGGRGQEACCSPHGWSRCGPCRCSSSSSPTPTSSPSGPCSTSSTSSSSCPCPCRCCASTCGGSCGTCRWPHHRHAVCKAAGKGVQGVRVYVCSCACVRVSVKFFVFCM